MKFITKSGSHYEIEKGRIRRFNPLEPEAADGEWVELMEYPRVAVGERVMLVTKSLEEFGEDDIESTTRSDILGVTARLTSEVERIEP